MAAGQQRMPQTKHAVVWTNTNEMAIVSSLASRHDTQVISIDPLTGRLFYEGLSGVDLFGNEEQALRFLAETKGVKSKIRAHALLGFVVLGSEGHLLVATKIRADMVLFGGHTVNTIAESQWIRVPLQYLAPVTRSEAKAFKDLQEFPIDGLHYYCTTLDVTRPFPSERSVADFDSEFCWNEWLASPFHRVGLADWTIVMLQGMAHSRVITAEALEQQEAATSGGFSLCLITRKSRINPGTRYNARGLNEHAGPGNEMECELIAWSTDEGEATWSSFVWRRGTVPVWFRSVLKGPVSGTAELVFRDKPHEGGDKYWERLLSRYGMQPITCVNMLRCAPGEEEMRLSEQYQEAVRYVKEKIAIDLTLLNFDWHSLIKHLGPGETVRGLWQTCRSPLGSMGVSRGKIRLFPSNAINSASVHAGVTMHRCPDGSKVLFEPVCSQKGVFRFNCADSLDRTNVATFFLAMPIVSFMLDGLAKRTAPPPGPTEHSPAMHEEASRAPSDGDEEENERDSLQPPEETPADQPEGDDESEWQRIMERSLAEMEDAVDPAVLRCLAEFFVFNGDVASTLYTNSPAAHSSLMRNYSPAMPSAPSNLLIAVRRRYQNVIKDPSKQSRYELILGLDRRRCLPSLRNEANEEVRWVSGPGSYVIRSEAGLRIDNTDGSDDPSPLLQQADVMWTCPGGQDVAEMWVYLRRPVQVVEFSLTVAHTPSTTSPVMLDVFVGRNMGDTHMAFQGLAIPRCASGTRLFYSLPTGRTRVHESTIYDFEDNDAELHSPCSRVLHFIFRGTPNTNLPLSIGQVAIFGCSAPASAQDTFTQRHHILSAIPGVLEGLEALGAERKEEVAEESDKDDDGVVVVDIGEQEDGPSYNDIGKLPMEERIATYTEEVSVALKRTQGRLFLLDALELERLRLEQRVSTQQRNQVLLGLGLRVEYFNPNRFVYLRDPAVVNALFASSRGKFTSCVAPTCQQPLLLSGTPCHYCFKVFCPECSSNAPVKIPEYQWSQQLGVCRRCALIIGRQIEVLAEVKALLDKQTLYHFHRKRAAQDELFVAACGSEHVHLSPFAAGESARQLALFPAAGIVNDMDTAEGSHPPEVLLFSPVLSPDVADFEWCAPAGLRAITLTISLARVGVVQSVTLFTGKNGLEQPAVPMVEIVGSRIADAEGGDVLGQWDLRNHSSLSPDGSFAPLTPILLPSRTSISCRCITINISFPGNGNDDTLLAFSLARISVVGKFTTFPKRRSVAIARSPGISAQPSQRVAYKAPFDSFKPLWSQFRGGKRTLDIGVEPWPLHGFTLHIKHGEEGVSSQVRLVRFTVSANDAKGALVTQMALGKFIVPKAPANTLLSFEFEKRAKGNTVTCEFLNNYGGTELTPCKVTLF